MNRVARVVLLVSSLALPAGLAGVAHAAEGAAGAKSLEQRVRELEDREAIRELLVVYGRYLDKKDLAGYSKLFAKDGTWTGGIGTATGPEGIYKMLETVYARAGADDFGDSYHIMSDFTVAVDGDTATSSSKWTWIVEGKDGRPEGQRSGHYEDTLVRENGTWKFKSRLTVTELPPPEKDTAAEIFRKDHRDKE